MAFRDLRDWIETLEANGELLRITREISLEPDAGAIGRAICDTEGPGVLAERVKGFKTPMTIGLHASWRRANMAIGLPPDAPRSEHVKAVMAAYDRYPLKSVMVKDAPCKENILTGDKVNVFQFPIPRLNIHDASFYLSKPLCITKDPDSGWVNMGMYRMMLLHRNRSGILFNRSQDISFHFEKYLARGQDMPMAVALGTEPVLPIMAGAKIPVGWSEFDFCGALRREPEELVKAETADLPVPARAEIVLEGVVKIKERVLEGPFGEFTGAYSGYEITPVFEIKCITHRNNPIYDVLYIGRPYAENHYMTTCSKVAGSWRKVRDIFPNITQVSMLPPYGLLSVVQGRWTRTGEPRAVMCAFFAHGLVGGKVIICVDEDVDPWDPKEVLWAVAARCSADKDLLILPEMDAYLDPSASLHWTTCKLGIDATKSRSPYYRSDPVGWVYARPETAEWKGYILGQLKEAARAPALARSR